MKDLKVLYEDNHIIVVYKPENILSQSDITGDVDMLTIVKEYVKKKYQKPGNVYIGLVHRLDRPTSGIMVFARTSKAASRLSKQIQDNSFQKEYMAVIHGILKEKAGIFEDYLEKRETSSFISNKENGKFAKLSYQVLSENKNENLSLVKIKLETGRHHQIRVQFASRGYPLYGDQRYGFNDKKQLCLVASSLSFVHPISKEEMNFVLDSLPKFDGFSKF